MATYFMDTSALIKRYIAEPGHVWVQQLCQASSGHIIVISEITLTEAVASFCRMSRENPPRLNTVDRDQLIRLFENHVRRRYVVVQLNRPILRRAALLCQTHPLRAYDAVQLASAITRRTDDVGMGNAPPVFVCSDNNLLNAARAENFQADNPNQHP